MRGHREKPRNITREYPCYLPANHVTGNYRYQVSHIPGLNPINQSEPNQSHFRARVLFVANILLVLCVKTILSKKWVSTRTAFFAARFLHDVTVTFQSEKSPTQASNRCTGSQ